MSETVERIICRQAEVGEIRGVRGRVLRPATGVLVLPGDDDAPPLAWHFGAFSRENGGERCVGSVTYLISEYDGRAAYQLRGMAVDEEFRGRGVGGRLIDFAEPVVIGDGIGLLWCSAREIAIPFYEAHGWRCVSEIYDVPGVGPHRRMLKVVGSAKK